MKNLILHFILFILSTHAIAQKTDADWWVDSVYASLNDKQRLGQLFIIRAHSNLGADHVAEVERLITQFYVGGLCFFQGTPEKQVELTNRYQALSKVPLFISMDAEWGLNMRLKDAAIAFPKQMMLGAIQDNTLIYRFGQVVAKECRRLGVHINFAPVADVNINPNNPVINERSFGEDKLNVAAKCFHYMLGMQDNGVMACAKHFPGHGDTGIDSHHDLPVVSKDLTALNELELMPFRVLNQHGIESVMVGHLQVPSIDNAINMPTSLSKNAVTDLLRSQMGYEGLIFTDGLEMKGVTKYHYNGEAEAKAIEAGCDVLCVPENVDAAFTAINRYISEGKIDTKNVEASVKRVLYAKYRYGLTTPQYIEPYNVRNDINTYEAQSLKRELVKNALTLVRDGQNIVPFKSYEPDSIATLSLGTSRLTSFQYMLNNYGIFNQFNLTKNISSDRKKEMLEYFKKKKTVIISLHDMRQSAKSDFGISDDERNFIDELNRVTNVILVVFGNPYSLKFFEHVKTIVVGYNEEKLTQELAAQALFGVFEFKGKLPVTACENAKCGMGQSSRRLNRLEWNTDLPEAVGINRNILRNIDGIVNEMIGNRATPGCQILVAKEGQVVYHKAFGHHTYMKAQECTTEDMYDLASVTKCAATTVSLMKLFEAGKFDLNEKLSAYVPILRGGDKEDILTKDVLLHQAGFIPWIPFYKTSLDSGIIDGTYKFFTSTRWYSNLQSNEYPIEVAKDLYMKADFIDSIKMQIVRTPLRDRRNYVYSDLGLILLTDAIKNITGVSLDQYAYDTYFRSLCMSRTIFNPRQKFNEIFIVPTEEDKYYRNQLIRGHVHDMAAAMMGGVSGHAGLFSTSADLAILMQMLLNKGEYGGIRYLKPETVQLFTSRQGSSGRRGIGWDMKDLNYSRRPSISNKASNNTFGHTGFTGNAVYADPDHNLIYIFLSNRTYPDMNNNRLISGEYRTRIQSVVYDAMKKNAG